MNRSPRAIRLCVVSPLYHPALGGIGRQAMLLTERLAEDVDSIFVIARRMKGMPQAAFSRKVRVYRAWSFKRYLINYEEVTLTNILVSLSFSISCAFLLFSKRKHYDVVHFHGASLPLFFNLPILKLLRKKVIAKVAATKIGTEAGSLRGRYFGLGKFISRLLKLVDAFIATSTEIEEELKLDGFQQEKINRITNFIDLSVFHPVSTDIKEDIKKRLKLGDHMIVTYSGRFADCKGISFLLESWKAVIRDFPDARLFLLGDGPILNDMKRLAGELGISDSVYFHGQIDNVAEFLNVTDVFVLSSLREGMPNSLLEAMACGIPVVAAKIGGVPDIIRDNENGIMVDPGDSEALYSGIRKILDNEELAGTIASNAYNTIKDSYDLDQIVPKYLDLYRKL